MTSEFVPSVCPHDCPSACALEVELIDDRTIGRVRGAKGNSYTQGVICSKVARYAERVHHPQRLLQPMKRVGAKGEGRFVPIGWDQALDEVAHTFQRVSSEHGPEAVWPYYYGGTMGQLQRDGINRLRHVMGYSGQQATICVSAAYVGWTAGVGALLGSDPRQMADSDLIVIWGCNAVATQVNAMTQVSRARKSRGARLVVIDPCRTSTAEKADLHLMLQPGSDGALACAVMQVLLEEGYADRDYLKGYTDFDPELEAHLGSHTPEWAQPVTGVSADDIREFARLLGNTKRSFFRLGIGFSRSRNGAHNMHAVSCLPAITGAWRHRGGGALLCTSSLFHLDKTLIEGLDARNPETRMLDMSRIGAILNAEPEDLKGGPPVKAMLIQNTNPMLVAPDLNRVRKGFEREDLFVCVHEQFMTETARMADILLPATTFLEHEDLYQTYGQVHLQAARAVIAPPGECRSNHQVICGLADRLGAKHPGFNLSGVEIIDATLSASNYPGFAELTGRRWLDCSQPFERMNFIDGFGWPDGRFRFRPDWNSLGSSGRDMPSLPGHWSVTEDSGPEHPLRMITPPAHGFLNSSFNNTPGSVKREIKPRLQMHPDDAAQLGLSDGELVRVGNRRGDLQLTLQVSPNIASGVVAATGLWPASAFTDGQGINSLVGAEAVAPNGGAAFHDASVWVRSAGS